MASPTGTDVHVDAALSTIATAYMNPEEALIGDKIAPMVSVPKQSDKYHIWDKAYWFTINVEPRASGDSYPEGLMKLSNDSFFAEIFHLAKRIADEDVSNEDPAVQQRQAAAEWISHQFALHRENKIATDFFTTGVWDTDVTLTSTSSTARGRQWDDYANSDPIAAIDLGNQTMQKNTARRANTLAVGQEVHDILKEHPLLLDKYKYTGTGLLSQQQVADALDIQNYLVGAAVRNTANPEGTFTGAYVWGKNALQLWVPASPGLRVPSAAYTFIWTALAGGNGFAVPITTIRDDLKDSDLIRGKHAFDDKVVGSDLGYFHNAAVA